MLVAGALFALSLLSASLATAAELRSLQAPVELSYARGADGDRNVQLQLEAIPRLELDLNPTSGLVLSARLRLDGYDELEPGRPAFDSYTAVSEPLKLGGDGTLELRDVYWERRLDSGLLRLGKQQIVWGRLDGIKVLDILNPQSFREFILDDFSDSRISLWSAYLDLFVGDWRIELAAIPDASAHEIPEPGAWYELRAPRFRFGATVGAPGLSSSTGGGHGGADDGALGLRLSRSLGRVDVSMLAYSGNDHEPLGRVVDGGTTPRIERFHERRELLGISAETAAGALALRAEAALQPSRTFNTRSALTLDTAEADQLSLGIGADIDGPFGVFFNAQFLWDEVIDAPDGLVRQDRDRITTLLARRSFAYETVHAEARWYRNLDDGDDLFRLRLDYDLDDTTRLYVEGDWFEGTRTGLFGQFRARDRVLIGVRRTF